MTTRRWVEPHLRRGASLLWICCLASSVLLAAACDDGDGRSDGDVVDDTSLPNPNEVEAAPPQPVTIASTTACALDADCAEGRFCFQGACVYQCSDDLACSSDQVCSERGRCTTASVSGGLVREGGPQDVVTGIEVVRPPETIAWVRPGDTSVSFTLGLSAPAPEAGIAYRIQRDDDRSSGQRLHTAFSQGNQLTFEVPVGDASPDGAEPRPVRVDLQSSLGAWTFVLRPEPRAEGRYGGAIALDTFGSTGLPIALSLVTEPAGATLSEASRVWLVLEVDDESIFSPARGPGVPDHIAAQLTYDDFVDRWVATFSHPFDLSDALALRAPDASQVERSMRFELELGSNGQLTGSFRDLWRGVYESRSMDGVISLADVSFSGTLLLERIENGPTLAQIDTTPDVPPAIPRPLPPPSTAACAGVDLGAVTPFDVGGTLMDCGSLRSIDELLLGTPDEQARCSIALSATALAGDTTSSQIAAFLDATLPNPGGLSFADFMAQCASGTNGTCIPSDEVLCARQVAALAYRNQPGGSSHVGALLDAYLGTTREAFLGPQFGALQTDTQTRLEWLKSTDYPAIATAAVRDLNERLLQEWQTHVLDNQFAVLGGQFDTSGLVALAREPSSAEAQETRAALLMEMTQSFQAAIEGLSLATRRWDALYVDASSRAARAGFVSARARELYLAAGVLRNLNLSAGTGFLSAGLGAGFNTLQTELARLSQPFNELIYARDAEVVVSTSVDPTVSNAALLASLEAKANAATATALETVTEVVATAQAEALDEQQLRNALNNEINDLRAELVNLCGLPQGCSVSDVFSDPACRVPVEAGRCGFAFTRGDGTIEFAGFEPGSATPSTSGALLRSILEAANDISIADADLTEFHLRAQLLHASNEAFADNVKAWNTMRQAQLADLRAAILELEASSISEIAQLASNMAERVRLREEQVAGARALVDQWEAMRIADQNETFAMNLSARAARETAAGLLNAAEAANDVGEALADSLPKTTGTSNDVTGPARLSISLVFASARVKLRAGATVADFIASGIELASERHQAMQSIELDALMQMGDIDDIETDAAVDALYNQALLLSTAAEAERAAIENTLRLHTAEKEATLAFSRDLQELNERRAEELNVLEQLAGLELRLLQAQYAYEARVLDYLAEVQRAQLVDAKLQELVRQRDNINLVIGSPSAVFSRANRITRAEERLNDAKVALMEWLVALEYFAVRPFMDQRIQILLARNPYQLEQIAGELARLQSVCGGAVNTLTAELSLRDDLLRIKQDNLDAVTGVVSTPSERLRQLMQAGYVPIDKRVRYTADSAVGDLLSRSDAILSASFYVGLDDFANLAATCNAKLEAIDIQLVGDLGTQRPTVSLLYDGTSELRSCQPGIDAYVAQFGPGTTSFGSTTFLRSSGRSISPLAGLNEFADSANTTLAGLPLASQYTVLIDTQLGRNGELDWDALEDIRLRVTYSYQDVFPSGRCE